MRIIIVLILYVLSASAIGLEIEAIGDDNITFTGISAAKRWLNHNGGGNINIYRFEDINRYAEKISTGMPSTEKAATEWFNKKMNKNKKEYTEVGIKAYSAQISTMRYGLTKYPAIVINGETVLYGLTNINDALSKHLQWKIKQ